MGHQNHIRNLNDVKETNINDYHLMGGVGDIRLPLPERNVVLHITSTMMHFLQLNGLFRDWLVRTPWASLKYRRCVRTFLFQNCLSGVCLVESIPFLINGRSVQMASRAATKIHHFVGRIGKRIWSVVMSLWDAIQSFKCLNRDPTHETWLRIKKMVLQCSTHGLPENTFF